MRYPARLASAYRSITLGGKFKKRFDIINHFARTRRLRRYLEIGTRSGHCLARIICGDKTGVDPAPQAMRKHWNIQPVTSDEFFKHNKRRFDLIFIDGLHQADQVVRDIYNSLNVLDAPGAILMHDCNPQSDLAQRRDEGVNVPGPWNGDTWKAIAFVRQREPELFVRVVNVDHGIGVIIPKRYGQPWPITPELERDAAAYISGTTYDQLAANRDAMLGLLSNRAELDAELARMAPQ